MTWFSQQESGLKHGGHPSVQSCLRSQYSSPDSDTASQSPSMANPSHRGAKKQAFPEGATSPTIIVPGPYRALSSALGNFAPELSGSDKGVSTSDPSFRPSDDDDQEDLPGGGQIPTSSGSVASTAPNTQRRGVLANLGRKKMKS